jgi:glutamate synthase domain-containing protein 2
MLIALEIFTGLFILMLGVGVLVAGVLYVIDRTQTEHAVRRNYPVIGRFRYLFEHLGEFFRQYFFAMDREEMPFNRAQRSWAYRAAKNVDNTAAFGSTRDLRDVGTVMFVNCPFPMLTEDIADPDPVSIGPGAREPYQPHSPVNISAMSFGSLSGPAILALSQGAAKAGIWLNTGEGGLSPHHLSGGCDIVFQIGTAKYGVRDKRGDLDDERLRQVAANEQVKMIELKLSQGAKPGKGGILPGAKVTEEISTIRGIPAGQDSISPNRHREISNTVELLDRIEHIREVTGLPTGFKTVIGEQSWLDELSSEMARRGSERAPDFITVDGGDGGTGAAPMPLMDNVGLTIQEALPLVDNALIRAGLRDRVKVICSGKRVSPTEVAYALCLGADFVNIARGFMFALGCIQAMQCNRNTCPTGITTHDPGLQKGLVVADKSQRVNNYAKNMLKEVGMIAHSCGVHEPRELRRHHARLVDSNGRTVAMDELYPYPD